MSAQEIKSLLLRMPAELYDRVKEAAAESRQSMTSFICEALAGTESNPIEQRFKELEKRIEAIEKKLKK